MRWSEAAVADERGKAHSRQCASKKGAFAGMLRSSRWTKEGPSGIIPTFRNEPDDTKSP
jgi:hypothetical protein